MAVWLVGLVLGWLVSRGWQQRAAGSYAPFWRPAARVLALSYPRHIAQAPLRRRRRRRAATPAAVTSHRYPPPLPFLQLPKPKWVDRSLKTKAFLLSTPPGLWARRVAIAAHLTVIIRCVGRKAPARWRGPAAAGSFRAASMPGSRQLASAHMGRGLCTSWLGRPSRSACRPAPQPAHSRPSSTDACPSPPPPRASPQGGMAQPVCPRHLPRRAARRLAHPHHRGALRVAAPQRRRRRRRRLPRARRRRRPSLGRLAHHRQGPCLVQVDHRRGRQPSWRVHLGAHDAPHLAGVHLHRLAPHAARREERVQERHHLWWVGGGGSGGEGGGGWGWLAQPRSGKGPARYHPWPAAAAQQRDVAAAPGAAPCPRFASAACP